MLRAMAGTRDHVTANQVAAGLARLRFSDKTTLAFRGMREINFADQISHKVVNNS